MSYMRGARMSTMTKFYAHTGGPVPPATWQYDRQLFFFSIYSDTSSKNDTGRLTRKRNTEQNTSGFNQ